MKFVLDLWNLITSDVLTVTAACVLAAALLGLLLLFAWPSGSAKPTPTSSRSLAAFTLMRAGMATPEIARKTGLSRDAIVLMTSGPNPVIGKNSPPPERSSALKRFLPRLPRLARQS